MNTKEQDLIKMGKKIQAIADVLKQRFGNMTVAETLDMATKILVAIERADAA
jgi:hypothetical protein